MYPGTFTSLLTGQSGLGQEMAFEDRVRLGAQEHKVYMVVLYTGLCLIHDKKH